MLVRVSSNLTGTYMSNKNQTKRVFGSTICVQFDFFQIRNYLRSSLKKVFFVYGPTGSGKSCLAAKTATTAG